MALLQSSYKSIWRIAYPIILGSFAQSIISVTDTAFLGRVGSTEQAAIGLISVYYLILFMIGFSYTKGTQIFVARRLGERRLHEVGRVTDNSFVVMFLVSIVIFIFLRFYSDTVLQLLIQDEGVRQASIQFLEVRSYGILFGYLGALMLSVYMGIGNTSILMVSIFSMSVINILLNYILIFGKWGFPAMGIEGAAWASNIAEISGTGVFFIHAFIAKYHHKYQMFRFQLSHSLMKDISNLSFPIVLQTIIGLGAWMIFFAFVEKMGRQPLAVSSIIKSIYTIFGIPSWGFASAANTIISNLMGQQKQAEVSTAIKRIIVFTSGLTALLCVPLAIFPKQFMRFYTIDQEIIIAGVPVIYVCIAALFVFSVSTILYNGVVSTGSSKVSLVVEIIAVLIYLVFVWSIFQIDDISLAAVWSAEIFYWAVIAILAYIYLKTGRWKKKVI